VIHLIKDLEYTKKQYNKEENVKRYAEGINIGLWNSEKIIFEKYIDKSHKILDLGCGAGRTTFVLYKLGYKNIIGIDIAEKLIDYAKRYSVENNLKTIFELGDATNLKYNDNEFDIVIFSYNGMQCIPGLENRTKVLKETYRVLKPGGYYIFTAHDRHDPKSSHLDFWKQKEDKWAKGINDSNVECLGDLITIDPSGEEAFIHFSTIDELKEFIESTKFEIVMHEYSYNIAEENAQTEKFAGKTVFWVLQK
jgi:ubiquinone/menaquinone biosynthesis C-methylase UbiE